MDSIALKTYAKINLALDVTGVREDGYHLVRMVMQSVDLYDEMRVRLVDHNVQPEPVALKCDKYYVPRDSRNTAVKAAEAVMKTCQGAFGGSGVRIDIKKNIPVSAGLAGGSSNAAGVIVALNSLLGLGMTLDEMCGIGAGIGTDIPFCIMTLAADPKWNIPGGSTCALAEGIGEVLTPVRSVNAWAVLAKPKLSISTPLVYKALDSLDSYSHPDVDSVVHGLFEGNLQLVQKGMGNVFENVTLVEHPEVAELKQTMLRYNDTMTLMSGTGPTVYSLFGSKRKAANTYYQLSKELKESGASVFMAAAL
ncbi:MAG: 4-(cytidine 5'-diphospho)-2-C-methyl-D-erythritol kinase [Anaerovoracaceae bacterium]